MSEKSPAAPDAHGGVGRPVSESASARTLRLLELARNGDRAAADALCRRYMPRLQRWASRRLPAAARDLLDTEDLVQEAMAKAILRVREFEPRHEGAFQGYLRTILLNLIRDAARRVGGRPPASELDGGEVDPGPTPFELAVGRELADRYERALARLASEDREAVILRIEMGSSYQEIADALEKPSAEAARKTVTRALVRIAQELPRDG